MYVLLSFLLLCTVHAELFLLCLPRRNVPALDNASQTSPNSVFTVSSCKISRATRLYYFSCVALNLTLLSVSIDMASYGVCNESLIYNMSQACILEECDGGDEYGDMCGKIMYILEQVCDS